MKIKLRIQIIVILSLVLATLVGLFLFSLSKSVSKTLRSEQLIVEVVKGVAELKILTDGYLMYQGSRSLQQWRLKYDHITDLMEGLHYKGSHERIYKDQIITNLKRIEIVFTDLTTCLKEELGTDKTVSAISKAKRERLLNELLVKSQATVSLAFQSQQEIHTELAAVRQRNFRLTVLFLVLLTFLIVGTSTWALKSLVKPILKLEKSMKVVGRGNLDYKVGITEKNEIGELSRAFDKMTTNLKKTTTSITELTKEIAERKRVEESLQEAHDELENRVKERTAELIAAQDQIIRSERLAATGQLAASIAHEINSPLQAITILLDTMKRKHEEDKELLHTIDLLKGAFFNIRDTVKILMDLNRPGKERKQMINVNEIIKNTNALIKLHLKKNKVRIDFDLSPAIPDIIASPQQLGHVFLNLINNAVEAMSGVSKSGAKWKERSKVGGEIFIKTMLEKDKIIIQVSDTGPGIAEEDLEHIFDPFYTRKKTVGMGIGLSICSGIIENHDGTIEAKNAKDGGAVFTVTLPLKTSVMKVS